MEPGHHSPLVDALEGIRHGSDDSFSQRSFIGACRGLGTPWMTRKVEFEIYLLFPKYCSYFGARAQGPKMVPNHPRFFDSGPQSTLFPTVCDPWGLVGPWVPEPTWT